MPIYEYRCPKCQKVFEEWSRITDDTPEEPCPDCGTPSPRILSSTCFVVEGGGSVTSPTRQQALHNEAMAAAREKAEPVRAARRAYRAKEAGLTSSSSKTDAK